MKTALFISLILVSSRILAQSDTIFPTFQGGEKALLEFIDSNLKYPEEALQLKVQGEVLLNMIVNEDGSISDIVVVQGIGGGCNEEAIRIANLTSGKWESGTLNNKTQAFKIKLPIKFEIIYGKNIHYLVNDPYKKGVELLGQEKYSEAIEQFNKFLKDFSSSNAFYARGLCYLQLEDYRNAISDLENANNLGDPDAKSKLTEAYLKYGNKCLEQKKYPAAIGIFTKALEFSPNEINVLFNRGIAYFYIGEKEKACADWELIKSLGSNESSEFLKEYCSQ